MSGIICLPGRWCGWGPSSRCIFFFSMQNLDWYSLNNFLNIPNNISFSYNVVVVFQSLVPIRLLWSVSRFLIEALWWVRSFAKKEWQKRTWFRQRCRLGSRNRTEIGDSGEDKRFEEGGYGDTVWVLRETLLLLLHIWIFLLY